MERFPQKLVFRGDFRRGDAVGILKFLQIPAVPDQHDLAEFTGMDIFEAGHPLSGTDAGPDHRPQILPVKGTLFFLFSEHSPYPLSCMIPRNCQMGNCFLYQSCLPEKRALPAARFRAIIASER